MSESAEKRTLCIVDDHRMLLNGLKAFLEENSGWSVERTFTSGAECLAYLAKASGTGELPAVIIVDVQLGTESGFALVEQIARQFPEIRCMMYSMYDSPGYVLQAKESGAKGYISKVAPEEELLLALKTVAAGGEYIEKRMEKMQESLKDVVTLFSRQEKVIFEKVLQGKTNREIADELFITVHAVENYVSFIYDKTYCKNRKELLRKFRGN